MVVDFSVLIQLITIGGAIATTLTLCAKIGIINPFNVMIKGLSENINMLTSSIAKLDESVSVMRRTQDELREKVVINENRVADLGRRVILLEEVIRTNEKRD